MESLVITFAWYVLCLNDDSSKFARRDALVTIDCDQHALHSDSFLLLLCTQPQDCGYVFTKGPKAWAALPDNWSCPPCGSAKRRFKKVPKGTAGK